MAFAQTFMAFILTISFGVLAAIFLFWIGSDKSRQDTPEEAEALDFEQWETTLLMR